MVPSIARELIACYSAPGDLVYDPFCGSGTTLVEASLTQRRSSGIDLNPLAVLLSRVKTSPLDPSSIRSDWVLLRSELLRSTASTRWKRAKNPAGRFLDLNYWYKPYVIRDLGFIRVLIDDRFPDAKDRIGNFMRVALARTAREVSNQRKKEFKRWRLSTARLRQYRPRPVQVFIEHVEIARQRMETYYSATRGRVDCKVARKDARTFKLQRRASLVVTSPPYGDSGTTVAYGQFSSFAMEWLGLYQIKPRRLDVEPTGSVIGRGDCLDLSRRFARSYRRVKRLDADRAHLVLQFFQGMSDSLDRMRESLKPSAYCCIVVGNRKVRGIDMPTDAILCELAEAVGLELKEVFGRRVHNKIMPYATKPLNSTGWGPVQSTLRRESILVFRAIE